MTTVRLAPSGPPILNDNGGPLDFGPGARLRMADKSAIIGDGSEPIPTAKTTIKPTGFGGDDANAIKATLLKPKPGARYGGEVTFDVINTSTNVDTTVDLYLDVSLDGGTSWSELASNQHHPSAAADLASDVLSGRQVTLHLPLVLGSDIGIDADTPSIMLRASASQPSYTGGAGCELYSPITAQSSASSMGTFYLKLEECF